MSKVKFTFCGYAMEFSSCSENADGTITLWGNCDGAKLKGAVLAAIKNEKKAAENYGDFYDRLLNYLRFEEKTIIEPLRQYTTFRYEYETQSARYALVGIGDSLTITIFEEISIKENPPKYAKFERIER